MKFVLFNLLNAKIVEFIFGLTSYKIMYSLGNSDPTRLGQSFETSGYIDPITK